jgi:ring-1,2-phenylacetyl-CoA epoxidase subunit PaaB
LHLHKNMALNSLDPRVNRLPVIKVAEQNKANTSLNQFGSFEVFVQPKEGKPFQHEGAVQAPNQEMAFVLAKETFTRRFTCVSICVADTRNVHVSEISEGDQNVYDLIANAQKEPSELKTFEIYHLFKRGKQHIHVGQVEASSAGVAFSEAKLKFRNEKVVVNVWAIASEHIRFTTSAERELWITLPEKKFRDASDYKGGEKLRSFLENSKSAL